MSSSTDHIYADYNATAPVKSAVISQLPHLLEKYFANPSGLHKPGQEAKAAMESARANVAKNLNTTTSEIIFTSSGTESDVLGVYGLAQAYKTKIKKVIVSAIEHPAILGQKELIQSLGLEFVEAPVTPQGTIDLNHLTTLVDQQPVLLSLMYANNETGVIQPINQAAEIVKRYDGLIHCDAVQAFDKTNLSLPTLTVDTLSISGHKIGALRGVGALYIRKGIQVHSIMGIGSHEKGIRPGTENLPGILSLGLACQNPSHWETVQQLRLNFEENLLKTFACKIAGQQAERLPNTTSVSFEGKNQDILLAGLDQKKIYASAGSACKASLSLPSHVLRAMNYQKNDLKGVVRFSFGPTTTAKDFDNIFEILTSLLQ